MSDADAATRLRVDVHSLLAHKQRREEILDGERFPETAELLRGQPFFKGDMRLDIKTALQTELLKPDLEPALRDALQLAYDNPIRETLRNASAKIDHANELQRRLDLYAGYLGDELGRDRTLRRAFEDMASKDFSEAAYGTALGCGLAFYFARPSDPADVTRQRVDAMVVRGTDYLGVISDLSKRLAPALAMVDSDDAAIERWLVEGDMAAAVAETKGEIQIEDGIPDEYLGGPAPAPEPEEPGVVVVPSFDLSNVSSHIKDIRKGWVGIAGERLPVAQVGDVVGIASRLVARWPYAEEVIHTLMTDLSQGGDVVFRSTCLVGEPGTGKTELLRALAEEVGLQGQTYDMGGQADSSLMGTSTRFSTGEVSYVMQVIQQYRKATGYVIWDEVDKPGDGRHNGSPHDAMLPYLSPHQAKRLRDPALGVDVDLSYISHFATANWLDKVPAPLKDRMRILRMPQPRWQHLGVLTEQILDRIAARWSRPRGWYPPLAQDEIDLIKDQWSGGSIRRLERYVEIIVTGRDRHPVGRA